MKVIIFGATGMVGQGVLRECLLDPQVETVLVIGRTPLQQRHAKLQELIHKDLENYHTVESSLTGYDACFFCLGTPSAGKSEDQYKKITYDITLAAATVLSKLNPKMTFIYVSGDGADSSEKGPVMWARVRGKTENDLLRLPFKAVYIFRPGIIRPLHGIQSKTTLYRVFYSLSKPLLPVIRMMAPSLISTTEVIGRTMLQVARFGAPKKILLNSDFEQIAKSAAGNS